MSYVALILSPIVWAMDQVLNLLHALVGNYGVAIIGLSIVVRVVMLPITNAAIRTEARDREVQLAMQPALADARTRLRGRDRFERIDEIYTEHSYHPVRAMVSLLPLFLQLPFLLSALVLLSDNSQLYGVPFLFIADLSRPDGLLPLALPGGTIAVNVLPIAITLVALVDAWAKKDMTGSMRVRFAIVAAVIAVLIYPLSAALCLYWLTSNLFSFARTLIGRAGSSQEV